MEAARLHHERLLAETATVSRWEPLESFDADDPGRTGEWQVVATASARWAVDRQTPIDRDVAGRDDRRLPLVVVLPPDTDVRQGDRVELAGRTIRVDAVRTSTWSLAVRASGLEE